LARITGIFSWPVTHNIDPNIPANKKIFAIPHLFVTEKVVFSLRKETPLITNKKS
jgi:hypothetical protein